MKIEWFIWRYKIASFLINLGINVMPDSEYKRELLRRLYELRVDVEVAVMNKEKNDE